MSSYPSLGTGHKKSILSQLHSSLLPSYLLHPVAVHYMLLTLSKAMVQDPPAVALHALGLLPHVIDHA